MSSKGATSDENGNFDLTFDPRYVTKIKFSAVGFKDQWFSQEALNQFPDSWEITLIEDKKVLRNVLIEADKESNSYRAGVRVYNIDANNDLGEDTYEVLDNLPSISVDFDGQISFRGQGDVLVLINGRPSALLGSSAEVLDMIHVDMIESIEVLTTPPAKYSAQGKSGVINIILKEGSTLKKSTQIRAITGSPHRHELSARKTGFKQKLGYQSSVKAGYRDIPATSFRENRNFENGSIIESQTNRNRIRKYISTVNQFSYQLNKKSSIRLHGLYQLNRGKQEALTNFSRLGSNGDQANWLRTIDKDNMNPKLGFGVIYDQEFGANKNKYLELSYHGSWLSKNVSSLYENQSIENAESKNRIQSRDRQFQDLGSVFNADFSWKLSDNMNLESGFSWNQHKSENDNENEVILGTSSNEDNGLDQAFTTDFSVSSLYAQSRIILQPITVVPGIRYEKTLLDANAQSNTMAISQAYSHWFPSLSISYDATDHVSYQIGYSKRIRRPNTSDLNPNFDVSNQNNIQRGNADLQPENIEKIEISTFLTYDKLFIDLSIYHQWSSNLINRVTSFEIASDSTTVSISQPENVGANTSNGIAISTSYKFSRKLKYQISGFGNQIKFDRSENMALVNRSIYRWSIQHSMTWKLKSQTALRLSSRYQPEVKTFQGKQRGFHFINLSIRQPILNKRASIGLRIQDVFNGRINERTAQFANRENYSRRRKATFYSLSFRYSFE